jgi:hypothetical protein
VVRARGRFATVDTGWRRWQSVASPRWCAPGVVGRSSVRSQFDAIDLAAIHQFVEDRQQEHLHLDFIRSSGRRIFARRDDRKNLAIAISGFANSDGGIVVWGVVAERAEDGVDSATDLQPLENLAQSYSDLQRLTAEATAPLVDGVVHRIVSGREGVGFLVTYVPRSDSGPHMAKLGEDRYYKRSGDSFRKMEHFDLEDMFGRRPKPRLSLGTRIHYGGMSRPPNRVPRYEFRISLSITNTGRGLARFPALAVKVEPSGECSIESLLPQARRVPPVPLVTANRRDQGRRIYAGGASDVIHMGTSAEFCMVKGHIDECLTEPSQDLVIDFYIFADGVAPVEGQQVVTRRQILAAVKTDK